MKQYVKIEANELVGILKQSQTFDELESQGVDNWHGYSEVDWNSIDEIDVESVLKKYELVEDKK